MGMGDKKIAYRPPLILKKCDVTKREWYISLINICPEPNVQKKFYHKIYGAGGKCIGTQTYVCMYVCQRCKYSKQDHGGYVCNYYGEYNE